MASVLQREEVRHRLSRIGKTAADVAREMDVSEAVVRGVINGHFKGNRGDAHRVAVTLGMKDGLVLGADTPIAEALKLAGRR